MQVSRISRQPPLCFDWLTAPRWDRHAIVTFLAVPDHAVIGIANRLETPRD